MELMQPYGPASTSILRYGRALLQAWLLGTVAIVIGISIVAPERVWLVPLALVGVIVVAALASRPTIGIYAAIACLVLAMNKEDGLQLNQVLYGLFAYAMLGAWYLWRWQQREPLLRSNVDRVVAFLVAVGFPFSIVTGVLFGGDLVMLRGETIAFSFLLFYFPIKETCRREGQGPQVIISLILFVAVVVTIRNVVWLQQILSSADQLWQIADARPGAHQLNLNETQLMAGALVALVLVLYVRQWGWRVLLLGLLATFMLALILTRSRGYWAALIVSLAVLFLILRGRSRWQMAWLLIAGAAVMFASMYALLGPIVTDLILGSAFTRFTTLETATANDISLLNRFLESSSAASKAKLNPLLGWGLGSYYYHYDIINLQTKQDFFIHNGYVALWFKHGIWGFGLFMFAWIAAIWHGLKTYWRSHATSVHRAIGLAAAAYLIGTLVSSVTSNPFPLRDQMLYFALALAVAEGIHQRYGRMVAEMPNASA